MRTPVLLLTAATLLFACNRAPQPSAPAPSPAEARATIARIYYWRARPGKIGDYSRYIHDLAEPIDHEAQRHGAFISVKTTLSADSAHPWTHMRVFLLRDSTQLAGLNQALDNAGVALKPDSLKRRARGAYSATLRDRAGEATVELKDGALVQVPLPGYAGQPVREGWLGGADGVSLFYRLVGSGADTIVCAGGGPTTEPAGGLRSRHDLEVLAAMGHTVIWYDLRGSGRSAPVRDASQLGLSRHVADLDAVLRHFRLAPAKLLGVTQGAALVAAWAVEHHNAADRIVFVSPPPPAADLDLQSVRRRVRGQMLVVEDEWSKVPLAVDAFMKLP